LLHIVEGGDYGYKRTYGRYGLHPYQAWQGELPGTLPMIAGIGEAPTAVIDANAAALPPDYRDTIIGASWGEHNLTLYRTQPAGVSLKASLEIMLEGLGHDDKTSPFRPSGLAVSPTDGAIYVSDWMLIDYTTHLRGRIWRITAKPGVNTNTPRRPYGAIETTPEITRLHSITRSAEPDRYPALREAVTDPDPFVRSAAITAMARPVFRNAVIQDLDHPDSTVRLGALLALRRADAGDPSRHIIPRLADPDLEVVKMAMIWAGEKQLRSLVDRIEATTRRDDLTKPFLSTWLATMKIMATRTSAKTDNKRLNRQVDPGFIEGIVHDTTRPALLRAMTMSWLTGIEKPKNHDLLTRAALGSDPELQIEAIRLLGKSARGEASEVLLGVAHNAGLPVALRSEAIAALSGKPSASLVGLLSDPDPAVQLEAARSLRALASTPEVQRAARESLASSGNDKRGASLKSQFEFLLAPGQVKRPTTTAGWQRLLSRGGDPDAGRRVFFSVNSTCTTCHSAEGRSVKLGSGSAAGFIAMPLGPDLSVIGRTADRNALIRSIVRPSDYVAPEYQGWYVRMMNGELHTGREIDQSTKAIQLILLDGNEHDYPRNEIESWGAMTHSLMPEGLAQTMAIEEFRDLIAYLESLR
ncbi:MAG: hypothetical protein ACYTGQ_19160, partial [Planctomycetota bacterium]